MRLPTIRCAATSINIAGCYVRTDGRCDCGQVATVVACFTIRDNEPTAILLCSQCADDFAECEAGNEYRLIAIKEIVDMAKRRKSTVGSPTKYDQKQILTWLAAQPEPVRAQDFSDVFGADRQAFRSLMNRWAKHGLVERVVMPNLYRAARPGVGYRVAG